MPASSGTHQAWKVLGPRCKAVYEQIVEQRLTIPLEIIAAAGLYSSRGYEALAKLAASGLINRSHQHVELGPISLDEFAAEADHRTSRIGPDHRAWELLGRTCQLVYEQIVERGMATPVDVFATVGIGSTTGYKALTRLAAAGLVRRGWRLVEQGSVSLDEFVATCNGQRISTD